jgi:hypothetical protein
MKIMKKTKKNEKQETFELELKDGKTITILSMKNTFCEVSDYEEYFEEYHEIHKKMPEA